jgi:hypothetical protein
MIIWHRMCTGQHPDHFCMLDIQHSTDDMSNLLYVMRYNALYANSLSIREDNSAFFQFWLDWFPKYLSGSKLTYAQTSLFVIVSAIFSFCNNFRRQIRRRSEECCVPDAAAFSRGSLYRAINFAFAMWNLYVYIRAYMCEEKDAEERGARKRNRGVPREERDGKQR